MEFSCLRCGQCCKWHGYVRFTEKEADSIALFLGIPVEDFIEKMTVITADRHGLSIMENDDGSCIFYSDSPPGCRIYSCRPSQCRTFPLKWKNPSKPCPGLKKS